MPSTGKIDGKVATLNPNALGDLYEALVEARFLFAHGVGAMTDSGDKPNQERNIGEATAILARIEAAIAKAQGPSS